MKFSFWRNLCNNCALVIIFLIVSTIFLSPAFPVYYFSFSSLFILFLIIITGSSAPMEGKSPRSNTECPKSKNSGFIKKKESIVVAMNLRKWITRNIRYLWIQWVAGFYNFWVLWKVKEFHILHFNFNTYTYFKYFYQVH